MRHEELLGLHPTVEQLSLENDLLLVKVGLLYADRVRLCSIGSALALDFLKLMGASPTQQLDFLEKYFAELAPTNPEATATMRKLISLYRDLRQLRKGTLSKAQIQTRFEIQAHLKRLGPSSKTASESSSGWPKQTELSRLWTPDSSTSTASRLAVQGGWAGHCSIEPPCKMFLIYAENSKAR
jgi:hypothetical protein